MPADPKPSLPRLPTGGALKILLGHWRSEIVFPDPKIPPMHGTTTFRWLSKNLLMSMRSQVRGKGPPKSLAVIGADDASKKLQMLYSDERGVARHYEMSLSSRRWELLRREKGFNQRFVGTFESSRKIRGRWEKSKDGRHWQLDFEVAYTKRR